MDPCDEQCDYREALDAMRDMVLIKGPESRLLWANEAFRTYYGMTVDELRNLIDGPQSDPDDTMQYVRDDRMVFNTADHLDIPAELVTDAAGVAASFHTIKSPIIEAGQVVRCVGVSRRNEDTLIAGRGLSHDEAKALARPLRLLTSSFPLAIALVDDGGRVVATSPLWQSTFGSTGRAIDARLLDGHPELSDLADPLAAALEHDRSSRLQIDIEVDEDLRVYDLRVGPWHYDDGSTGGALILAIDVTAEANRQADLEASNERHQLVLGGASVGIWDKPSIARDEEYWSDRYYELLGYEPGEIAASTSAVMEAIHPDDRQRAAQALADHYATDATFDLEYRMRGKSGTYRWYRASGKVARDGNGDPTRMVGSIQDIDSRLQAEQDTRRVNEDLEHFVHVAAHDLREPARRQILLIELMLARHGDHIDEDLRRQLEQVQDQSRKMLDMVTGFRSLTGIAGPTLEVETVDLAALVDGVVTELIDPDDDVDVSLRLQSEVLGYPTLLEVLVRNLIGNAVTHGPRPLKIDISEYCDGAQRVIAVVSTANRRAGPGSDDELFKPFVRRDPSAPGSGLGLSICRRVVDRHRGKIWIEPSDDTFSVHFTLGEQ